VSKLTKWKITLLATQWLLLSAQTIPPDVIEPPLIPRPMFPMVQQELVLPPKEFDHEYDGILTIQYYSAEDIYHLCRNAARQRPGRPMACTYRNWVGPGTCRIHMMSRDELEKYGCSYEIILRHEIGHCNGWRHD
jgi:hypothetical protein